VEEDMAPETSSDSVAEPAEESSGGDAAESAEE